MSRILAQLDRGWARVGIVVVAVIFGVVTVSLVVSRANRDTSRIDTGATVQCDSLRLDIESQKAARLALNAVTNAIVQDAVDEPNQPHDAIPTLTKRVNDADAARRALVDGEITLMHTLGCPQIPERP